MFGRSTSRTNTLASVIPSEARMRSCISFPAVAVKASTGGEPSFSRTSRKPSILGPEIATPLIDAMGLVHDQKRRRALFQPRALICASDKETLRCNVECLMAFLASSEKRISFSSPFQIAVDEGRWDFLAEQVGHLF